MFENCRSAEHIVVMSMPNKRRKRLELALAAHFGGARAGPRGKEGSDIVGVDGLAIEVKDRKRLATWLLAAMQQSVDAAAPNQIPIVILHQCGMRHAGDLVMLRLQDFDDLIDKG